MDLLTALLMKKEEYQKELEIVTTALYESMNYDEPEKHKGAIQVLKQNKKFISGKINAIDTAIQLYWQSKK